MCGVFGAGSSFGVGWRAAVELGGGGVRFLLLGGFVLVLAKFSFYVFGAGHWAIALCGFGICLISLIS